ncbi:amino acid permease [Ceratobasidium sp. AG-Ba]|nr:amino acid permease [Ceratobasidium sp. AG-Ba]
MSHEPLLATNSVENNATYTVQEEDTGLEAKSSVPIEDVNPLGYGVGFWSATLLNISGMIGSGIFSTSSLVIRSVGSVGMLLVMYIIAPLVTYAGLTVYIELASMCGHKRSGAEVVYLEQAYPRPKYLVSTTFAITTLLAGYAGMGSTVFAKHAIQSFGLEYTPFRQKLIAITHLSSAVAVCLFSTKWALRMNNVATVFKPAALLLITLTGVACMLGWIAVPYSGNLNHPFDGTSYEGNALATSFVKVNFSFVNWNLILNLTAEIKGRDPIRTAQSAGFLSVFITSVLYMTTVLSFVVVMTKEKLVGAGEVLGAKFLQKVYGDAVADKLFLLFIGMSTYGGAIAVVLSYTRMIREAGRQGVLPFATFWSQVSRFKTPYGPVRLKWALSVTILLIVPAKDTFSFLVDLASYPGLVFALANACGLWILRRRRAKLELPEHAHKAWNIVVLAYVMKSVGLLVMPWISPKSGSHGGDVDFFYATYCIVGIMVLMVSSSP